LISWKIMNAVVVVVGVVAATTTVRMIVAIPLVHSGGCGSSVTHNGLSQQLPTSLGTAAAAAVVVIVKMGLLRV
jgi:imidazole glycerol phosphate synthase subunit HisF